MEKEILSCRYPAEHGDKWLLIAVNEKNEVFPCFACCTLSLEDKQELGLRKRVILSSYRDLMESNAQILINVVEADDQIVFHTVHVFMNLINCNDERFLKLSGECLLLFLIHMKKEGLGLAVMQRLTIEIEEDCNFTRSLPHFYILGRLFQVFPDLVLKGACVKSKFLHILANGLSYPLDEVKAGILFLLLQIYQNNEKNNVTPRSLDAVFAKSFLRILKCTQNKDLLKLSLGLLQIFISKVLQNVSILFEISTDEVNLIDIIKKIILSNEAPFQICIVQCVCHLLNNPSLEKQITLLLEANIPEILFDALSTKNELLLESILCCLHLFMHHAEAPIKNHFVFGIGVIIEVCYSLLALKNWRLLCTTLNILTSVISGNEYLLPSSHMTFYYQSVQLTEKGFLVQNPSVLLAVCKYFNEFLKNKDLPWALPLEQIYNNVNLCLKSQRKIIADLTVSKQIKDSLKTSKLISIEMKLLICSLNILTSCFRLFKQYSCAPVAVEKGFTCPSTQINYDKSSPYDEKSAQHLMMMCLSSLDEIFIPCCLHC